jgi:hypothetical protein
MAPNPFCLGFDIHLMRIQTLLCVAFLFCLASNTALAQESSNSSASLAAYARGFIGLSLDSTKKRLTGASLREEKSGREVILHAKFAGDSVRGSMSIDAIAGPKGIREVTFTGHFFNDQSFAQATGDMGDEMLFPGGKMTSLTTDGDYPDMHLHLDVSSTNRTIQVVAKAQ